MSKAELTLIEFINRIGIAHVAGESIADHLAMAKHYIANLQAAKPAEEGEVVITTNLQGDCVAVTRQDEESRILSVIWQKLADNATQNATNENCESIAQQPSSGNSATENATLTATKAEGSLPVSPYIYGRECAENERVYTEQQMLSLHAQAAAEIAKRDAEIARLKRESDIFAIDEQNRWRESRNLQAELTTLRAQMEGAKQDVKRIEFLESVKDFCIERANWHVPVHSSKVKSFSIKSQNFQCDTVRSVIDQLIVDYEFTQGDKN